MSQKKAIILLSGGLDSATTAAIATNNNYELFALSFNYGQKHLFELEAANNICNFLKISNHKILDGGLKRLKRGISCVEKQFLQNVGQLPGIVTLL